MGVDATMLEGGGSPTSTRTSNFTRLVSLDSEITDVFAKPLPTRSDIPAWKCLIDRPLTSDERISLITEIFSDRNEIEVVRNLRGRNAQSFVNVIHEVRTRTPSALVG